MTFSSSSFLVLTDQVVSADILTIFVGTLILGLFSGGIWAVMRRMTAWIWR